MKKSITCNISIIVICILLISSSVSMSQENDSTDREYYAIIVGVEIFKGLEYNDTVYIDEDAIGFYEKLLESKNWNEENIKLLINENATKENIQQAITSWLSEKEHENDVVLIYFSGHGWKTSLKNRIHGNAYFFTYNSSDFGYDEKTKITDKELDGWLDVLDSKNIVLILDYCFSGRMHDIQKNGRIVLAAGGRYLLCPVDEDSSLKHGIFTYFLLQGLGGVADLNNDGWVSAKEVFRYSRFPTFWFSLWKQLPTFFPQLPYMYDGKIQDITFFSLE